VTVVASRTVAGLPILVTYLFQKSRDFARTRPVTRMFLFIPFVCSCNFRSGPHGAGGDYLLDCEHDPRREYNPALFALALSMN
jgi:hypothetical protein